MIISKHQGKFHVYKGYYFCRRIISEAKQTDNATNLSFRVSPGEFQRIDTEAAAAGLRRADYVRAKVIAPDQSRRIKELEQQVDELTKRLSKAVQDCVELEGLALRLQQRLQATQQEHPSGFWHKLTRNISNR